jgi:hypothetical protein
MLRRVAAGLFKSNEILKRWHTFAGRKGDRSRSLSAFSFCSFFLLDRLQMLDWIVRKYLEERIAF